MQFTETGPGDAETTILLAHGAGAPMDSAAMEAAAQALAANGLRVIRFEFQYMAERRSGGAKRPPPKIRRLLEEYLEAVAALPPHGRLVVGGKSMGGRVASMIADQLHEAKGISGVLCLGYPFHPPQKPSQTRTAHLQQLQTPTLIVQGTRDPFGSREDVESYSLSSQIELLWLEDGDHDLKPRKSISGFTADEHMNTMAKAVRTWAAGLSG